MASCSMACVKQLLRPMDVIEVTNIGEGEGKGKKVYGMGEFQIGAFKDVHDRLPKYW